MLAVYGGCDVMVEGERVPGEAAVRPKRCRDPLEAAATIGPRGQMQQRPPRAVDQGRRLLDFKLPYVSFTQVELDSLLNCAHSSLREHRRRRVNPYYTPARCLSNRDRNAPVANCKLDQWPVSITGKPDVERDVSSDASGPVPVSVRPGVVPARHGNTNLRLRRARQRASGGLYRYRPLAHALEERARGDVGAWLTRSTYAFPFVENANLVVALVATFERSQKKYGPRGYRYILLEAGHAAQNLCLRATELGLATLCIGGFVDGLVNEILELRPTEAGVVYMVAAGYATG